jgi:hypothetical protein
LLNIDLATQVFNGETVGQIVVEETAVVGIFFTIQNVDTSCFDLSLADSESSRFVILHGEDFRTNEEGSGSWGKSLRSGMYQSVLTTEPNPGRLSIDWGNFTRSRP